MELEDGPSNIYWLRREYQNLQRRLPKGQDTLQHNIQGLKSKQSIRKQTSRLMGRSNQTKTSTPKASGLIKAGKTIRRRSLSARSQASVQRINKRRVSTQTKSLVQGSSPYNLRLVGREADVSSTSDLSLQERMHQDTSPSPGRSRSRNSAGRRQSSRLKGKENLSYFGSNESDSSSARERDILTPEKERNISTDSLSEISERLSPAIQNVTPQPKSILLNPSSRKRGKTPNRVAFVKRLNEMSGRKRNISSKDRSLLGYDWIAGVLESDSNYAAQSDEFFEEIRAFRRANRDECVHDSVSELSLPMSSSFVPPPTENESPESTKLTHKCIHNYTINDRLFSVPLHEAPDGESMCAICKSRRKPLSTRNSPSYIRVSIPRSTLVSPYRVKSHRRRSYDPTDSLGLSKHCLAGWQSSKPSMMPTAGTLDIRSSLTVPMHGSEVHPPAESLPPTRRIPRISKRTQELMNTSLAIQLNAQRAQQTGILRRSARRNSRK